MSEQYVYCRIIEANSVQAIPSCEKANLFLSEIPTKNWG
jgi:hypothetical protein